MNRILTAFALAGLAFTVTAKDCKFLIDPGAEPLVKVTKDFPGFGYVDDPKVGGEETVLEYRHAGAWVLKTKKCDDATLKFLCANKIRLLLVLDGKREDIVADLKRICDNKFGDAIAGFQLGEKVDGEGDADKWRALVGHIVKRFPGKPIAIPAKDAKPPMVKMLADQMRSVTHLIVDLSDKAEPYRTLKDMTKAFAKGSNKDLKRVKIWTIAPDRIPGTPESERDAFATVSWKIHWLCAAYAVEKVDAVLFKQPMKADTFGYTLRYLGVAFHDHPIVAAHGESETEDAVKANDDSPDLDQDFEDGTGGFGGAENMKIVPSPKACGNVAAKKKGDVEFLALYNGSDRMCIVLVNTSGKRTRVTTDLKKMKSGNATYRRMYLDPETKEVKREALGAYGQPGLPFTSVIDPNCIETVTFIMTKQNFNQAGY